MTFDVYRPRALSLHGVWDTGTLRMKIYGLVADGKEITDEMLATAQSFLNNEVVPTVSEEGSDNG